MFSHASCGIHATKTCLDYSTDFSCNPVKSASEKKSVLRHRDLRASVFGSGLPLKYRFVFERPGVVLIWATSESDYRFDGDVEDGAPSPSESNKPSRADAKPTSAYDVSSPFSFSDMDQDSSFNEFLMGGDPSFQSWGPSPMLEDPSQQGGGRSLGRSPRGRTSFRAASERSRRTRSDSYYGNDGNEYSNYDSRRKQYGRPFGREGESDSARRSVSQRRQRRDDYGRGDAEQDTPFTYDLSNPDYGNTNDFLQDDIFNFDGPSPARRRDFRQRDDPSRSRNSYDSRRGGRQSNFRSRERHSQPSQGQYQSRRGAVVSGDGQGQGQGRAEGRREEAFSEGYTMFRGHRVYYKIYGSARETAGKFPILVVHGGPGLPHDYLLPLAKLHTTGRRVIFYDQLGCGKSASDLNADVLKLRQEGGVELFRDELQHIRSELGLWDVHLFAHHWGGCVALEHVLNKPVGQGVVTLCVASTPPSLTSLLHAQHDLVSRLPEHHQRLIQAADPSDPEYAHALDEFNRQFLCRCEPWPQCLEDALAKAGVRYRGMEAVGEWTAHDRLGAVDVPTLVCSGEHDHVAPADAEAMAEAIPNAEHILYGSSSHMAHLEEQELFLTTYNYFLTQAEDARRAANWYAFQ